MGVKGGKPKSKWAKNGRLMLRHIIASARGVRSNDKSDQAYESRTLASPKEYNDMICVIRVGVEYDKTLQYPPRNTVLEVITPDHPNIKR